MVRIHNKKTLIKEELYNFLEIYKVSLLSDILDYFRDKEVVLNIEIKVDDNIDNIDDDYIYRITETLYKLVDYPQDKILISSFSKRIIEHLLDNYRNTYTIVPIFDQNRYCLDFLKKLINYGVNTIVLDKEILYENIKDIWGLNLTLFVYGILDINQDKLIQDKYIDNKIMKYNNINIITDRIDSIVLDII